MIDYCIELVDRAAGRLIQLMRELVGINGSHFTASSGDLKGAGIPGGPDVGFLQEFQIGIMRMHLERVMVDTQPLHIGVGARDGTS